MNVAKTRLATKAGAVRQYSSNTDIGEINTDLRKILENKFERLTPIFKIKTV